MIVLSGTERDADRLEDYIGLSRAHPLLAAVFAGMLLSLAGLPLTAGFVGKFYLLAAGVGAHLWVLVAALVISSTISLFYYLRFIAAAYAQPAAPPALPAAVAMPRLARLAIAVLVILLLWLGVYPAAVIRAIQEAVAIGR
jgi:NADH-quinone oxidoreductase subunit N